MKILSINCRGLGNLATVGELHGLVKKEVPKIVFLMETRLHVSSLEILRIKLGMHGCLGVNRHGFGGGLALLWAANVVVHVQSYSTFHIDAHVVQDDGCTSRLTRFYGHLEVSLRSRSWTLLPRLHALFAMPWLVLRDFNEITALEEKFGRNDRNLHQMAAFRDALTDCSLLDLGFIRPLFTWSNGRANGDLVRVRLDRGVANPEWKLCFPNTVVRNIVVASSDHLGLLVEFEPGLTQQTKKHRKLFRFEHVWVREPGCEEVIHEAWHTPVMGTPMYCIT